jgi:RimJ/RimL family protein N-acetyltransferase
MRIEITRDPHEFAARTQEFLAARLERNVLATVLDNVLRTIDRPAGLSGDNRATPGPVFAIGSDPSTGQTVAAALRTPPWPMIASGFDDAKEGDELLERWLDQDPQLDGLGAEPPTATALTQAWRSQTGGMTDCVFREALHSLTVVRDPPRPTTGRLRRAIEDDRALLVEWEIQFGTESGHGQPTRAAANVDRRLAAGQQFIWDDGGPTSTLAHNVEIAGAVRIGPVYTPRRHRNRGYASAAVAALSRRLLTEGAERCLLFTDLANPTSNRIYASVGYVRFADWEQHRLTAAPR